MEKTDIGNFVKWGASVSVDMAQTLLSVLPLSQPEDLVEIPIEETPSDECLDIRVSSY